MRPPPGRAVAPVLAFAELFPQRWRRDEEDWDEVRRRLAHLDPQAERARHQTRPALEAAAAAAGVHPLSFLVWAVGMDGPEHQHRTPLERLSGDVMDGLPRRVREGEVHAWPNAWPAAARCLQYRRRQCGHLSAVVHRTARGHLYVGRGTYSGEYGARLVARLLDVLFDDPVAGDPMPASCQCGMVIELSPDRVRRDVRDTPACGEARKLAL